MDKIAKFEKSLYSIQKESDRNY